MRVAPLARFTAAGVRCWRIASWTNVLCELEGAVRLSIRVDDQMAYRRRFR